MRRIGNTMIIIFLLVIAAFCIHISNVYAAEINENDFLMTEGKNLRNNYGTGSKIILRGVNAGGWLVQEMWMCPTSYSVGSQMELENTLLNRFGTEKTKELLDTYYDNFWTEEDFKICASYGMNVIRLPFWYRNLVDENGNFKEDAFERIDWFVSTAGKYGLYVILDMHGAPGSQNAESHSGDISSKGLWEGADVTYNQNLYIQVWKKIAEHYNDNPIVAGYDLLNEPYCAKGAYTDKTVWDLYDKAYDAIREVDKKHIIIMEATWEPYNLPNPSTYGWKNVMYEYHCYNYDNQTDSDAQLQTINNKINLINKTKYNCPSYIGETSFFSNTESWEKCLKALNDSELSWTLWTYKVTGDGTNSWGMYNMNIGSVDVTKADFDRIKYAWSQSKTNALYINESITEIIKDFISFSPSKAIIGDADIIGVTDMAYTGKQITLPITVKMGDRVLSEGYDYKVSYSNNKECGKATVTITGQGDYDGTKTVSFYIVPEVLSKFTAVKNKTKSLVLEWKKSDNAQGYLIYQYKNGKYAQIAKLKSYYSRYTVKKLKAGTTYRFRICSYTIIDGKIYQGKTKTLSTSTKVKTPTISLKTKTGKVIATWKKVNGAKGYQIYMSGSKKGKYKKTKSITSTDKKQYSYQIKKSGTYFIKVRAYSKINGKVVYGAYSTIKKMVVK